MAHELEARDIERLLLDSPGGRRYVQDSPILPDVWKACWIEALRPSRRRRRLDLLVTPYREVQASTLALELQERLDPAWLERAEGQPPDAGSSGSLQDRPAVAYNASTVAARLRFEELVRVVLPLTEWWRTNCWVGRVRDVGDIAVVLDDAETAEAVARAVADGRLPRDAGGQRPPLTPDLLWMIRVVGAIALAASGSDEDRDLLLAFVRPAEESDEAEDAVGDASSGRSAVDERLTVARRMVEAIRELVRDLQPEEKPLVFSVNRNRPAEISLCDSALAVKADAARHLFDVRASDIAWAVLDSGIDARHPAFGERVRDALQATGDEPFPYRSRVVKTFDFSLVRYLLSPDPELVRLRIAELAEAMERRPDSLERWAWEAERDALERLAERLGPRRRLREAQDFRQSLQQGRQVDWDAVREVLEIPHDESYRPPVNHHGTHVAGILGGHWRLDDPDSDELSSERDLLGVCPDIRLYDLRVLGPDGRGDEFAVIAALQFVRHLNSHKDYIVVHGANLSLSIRHEVSNYACGRTPVCEEAERLVASGVVVVAAAGNRGYLTYLTQEGPSEGYHSISITDPGNAQNVITVGATHRSSPHTYGVSYFSSRGPTGDGRSKPDLVAPGEKILSTIPEKRSCRLDGTSMAAPHVSGAAALLMARHRELAGQPRRVKEILSATATDLGRERYFQGAGMLDALRALQSV